MAPTLVPDPIGLAIASAAKDPGKVRMEEIRVALGPAEAGRFVMLAVPADLQMHELLGLVGYLAGGGLASSLAEAKAARGPQLKIARSMPT